MIIKVLTNQSVKEMSLQQVALATFGFCPFCEQTIKDFDIPKSADIRDRMRKFGIDPDSGHLDNCSYRYLRL